MRSSLLGAWVAGLAGFGTLVVLATVADGQPQPNSPPLETQPTQPSGIQSSSSQPSRSQPLRSPPVVAPANLAAVQARISTVSPLLFAGEAMPVRFELFNTAQAPVTISVPGGEPAPEGAAVGLPDAQLFNPANQQGVWVVPVDDPLAPTGHGAADTVPVAGLAARQRLDLNPAALIAEGPPSHLTLAARSGVSRELDLARYFPRLKTPGVYELVWRPAGGAIGSNALTVRVVSRYELHLTTDAGDLTLELLYHQAPLTCLHIIRLVQRGYYDGLIFHRVAPGLLIQTGREDHTGQPRESAPTVVGELSSQAFEVGQVAMARRIDPQEGPGRTPRPEFANSAAGQFFIGLARVPDWDGRFTVFARLKTGQTVAQTIAAAPTAPKTSRPLEPVVIKKAVARLVKPMDP